MAYPYYNYNPYQQGYFQPSYQQMQNAPQQMMAQNVQNTAQPYSPAINQSGIIWISGPQEAAMFPVGPNSAVALWQKDGKTIFLKQADATGKPTMRVYDLVERTETPSDGVSEQGDKLPAYATKDELSAVVGVVKGFDELIGSIKSDVEAMKGDMYGIAGKKRTTTKKTVEVADDE